MKTSPNRSVAALLVIGSAICLALLPWSRWFGKSLDEKLTQRLAEYVQLRIAEDWVSIYAMVDPVDRRVVPIQRFLVLYASGAIRTISLTETSRAIDLEKGTAAIEMTLDGELRLDRLPPETRKTLAPHDESSRRQTGAYTANWSLRDGQWWLRLEREAVTGRSSDGKPIGTLGG
ncbi:MAG: hypothetical protein JNL08_12200 [Planctomycetes bacterium]|nr:hypothetical protein [Planctomycetota bacterium]